MTLYHQHLPRIDEIVLFSGFNNLGLARQPDSARGDNGAFFNCNTFFDALNNKPDKSRLWPFSARASQAEPEIPPGMEQQLAYASTLTINHLTVWKAMADLLGAHPLDNTNQAHKVTDEMLLSSLPRGSLLHKNAVKQERLKAGRMNINQRISSYGSIDRPLVDSPAAKRGGAAWCRRSARRRASRARRNRRRPPRRRSVRRRHGNAGCS